MHPRADAGCLFGKQRKDKFGAGTLGAKSEQGMLLLCLCKLELIGINAIRNTVP